LRGGKGRTCREGSPCESARPDFTPSSRSSSARACSCRNHAGDLQPDWRDLGVEWTGSCATQAGSETSLRRISATPPGHDPSSIRGSLRDALLRSPALVRRGIDFRVFWARGWPSRAAFFIPIGGLRSDEGLSLACSSSLIMNVAMWYCVETRDGFFHHIAHRPPSPLQSGATSDAGRLPSWGDRMEAVPRRLDHERRGRRIGSSFRRGAPW